MLISIPISMALRTLTLPWISAWQPWLIVIVAADILVAIAAMLLLAVGQKKRAQKRLALELTNQGNLSCSYELRAENPEGGLTFSFRAQGRELALQTYGVAPLETGAVTIQTRPPAPPTQAGHGNGANVIGSAMAGGRAVSDVLRTASMIAPSAARGPLQKAIAGIWRVQATTQRANRLQGQVSQLAGMAEQAQPAVQARNTGARPQATVALAGQAWARTPLLQPGEVLIVELLIRMARSVPGQRYAFTILSRLADQPEASIQVEQGSVLAGERSWIRRYGPYLLVEAIAIAVLILAFWLASVGVLGQ